MTESQQNEAQAIMDSANEVLAKIDGFASLTGEIESAINEGLASLKAQQLSAVTHIESTKVQAIHKIRAIASRSYASADNPNFQHPKDKGCSSDQEND